MFLGELGLTGNSLSVFGLFYWSNLTLWVQKLFKNSSRWVKTWKAAGGAAVTGPPAAGHVPPASRGDDSDASRRCFGAATTPCGCSYRWVLCKSTSARSLIFFREKQRQSTFSSPGGIKRDEEIPGNPWCRWGRSWWRRRPGSIQTPCWRCEPCSPAKTTNGSERCNATKKGKCGNTKSPLTFSPGVQCSLRGRSTSRTVEYKMTDDTNTDRRGRC